MRLKSAERIIEKYINKTWEIGNKSVNLKEKGWFFGGFTKSKTNLGICYISEKKIVLSEMLTLLLDNNEVNDTILHELAHAICWVTKRYKGHGLYWKYVSALIGCNGKRCFITNDKLDNVTNYNFIAVCPKHGLVHGWVRKPKNNKKCDKCDSKIEIIEK